MATLTSLIEAGMGDIVSKIFIKQVRSLPPELHNYIYDLTFSAANFERNVCHVDGNYKPPTVLQVNRHLRSTLSTSFYKSTTFTFADEKTHSGDLNYLAKFFGTLAPARAIEASGPEFWILSTSTKVTPRPMARNAKSSGYHISRHRYLDKHDSDEVEALMERVTRAYPTNAAFPKLMWNARLHIQTRKSEQLVLNSEFIVPQKVARRV